MLEEKAISCYDCSTKAYFLPDETESNYKNTENSLKSRLKYIAKIRIFVCIILQLKPKCLSLLQEGS